jgi:hypothetical protein
VSIKTVNTVKAGEPTQYANEWSRVLRDGQANREELSRRNDESIGVDTLNVVYVFVYGHIRVTRGR